jgi:hypothetical protein
VSDLVSSSLIEDHNSTNLCALTSEDYNSIYNCEIINVKHQHCTWHMALKILAILTLLFFHNIHRAQNGGIYTLLLVEFFSQNILSHILTMVISFD